MEPVEFVTTGSNVPLGISASVVFSFGGVDILLGCKTLVCLHPFADMRAFGRSCPTATRRSVPPVFSSTAVTSFHWPGVKHYYGIICHPTPHSPVLRFRLFGITLAG